MSYGLIMFIVLLDGNNLRWQVVHIRSPRRVRAALTNARSWAARVRARELRAGGSQVGRR